MTEGKFKKLVNLYIDKEISAHELELLKQEISSNMSRRNEFNQFCKVHLAEKKAFLCQMASAHAQGNAGTERPTGQRSTQRTCRLPAATMLTLKFPTRDKTKFTHLLEYGGMAAGLTLFLFFAGLALKQSSDTRNLQVTDGQSQELVDEQSLANYLAAKNKNEHQEFPLALDEVIANNQVVSYVVDNAVDPQANFDVFAASNQYFAESAPHHFLYEPATNDTREFISLESDENLRHSQWRHVESDNSEYAHGRAGYSFSRVGFNIE